MAGKFHINGDGDVRPCKASKRECRFGVEAHFSTVAEAEHSIKNLYDLSQGFSKFNSKMSDEEILKRLEFLKEEISKSKDIFVDKNYSLSVPEIKASSEGYLSYIQGGKDGISLVKEYSDRAVDALAYAVSRGEFYATIKVYGVEQNFHIDLIRYALDMPVGIENKPKNLLAEVEEIEDFAYKRIFGYFPTDEDYRKAQSLYKQVSPIVSSIKDYLRNNKYIW